MAFTDRSAQTRAAILAAAQERFAADGYERATIRAIAADAGIDPSMVIRYFGSKDELYVAASTLSLPVPDFLPAAEAGHRYARDLVDIWDKGAPTAWIILLRTAVTRPEAAQRFQDTIRDQVAPPLRAAFPDDPDFDLRLSLVVSQTYGFVLMRYLLKFEPLASADPDVLVARLGETIQDHLTRPLHA
jgi:AcrR family transcriptional regulator